jgi:hypothetical protein
MRAQLRAKSLGELEHLHFTMRDENPQPAAYMAVSLGELEKLKGPAALWPTLLLGSSRADILSHLQTSGGMINDTCVHDFDLARALLDPADEPLSIVAYGSTVIDEAACKEAGDVMRVCVTMATRQGVLLSITSESFFLDHRDPRALIDSFPDRFPPLRGRQRSARRSPLCSRRSHCYQPPSPRRQPPCRHRRIRRNALAMEAGHR